MSKDVISIEAAVKPVLLLTAGEKTYTVEFPFSAVIKAEEKVGHSLKTPGDWFGAPSRDIPLLLEVGLAKHHPEVTAEEVAELCESLDPEAIGTITEALGAMAFPRFIERYRANLERAREGKLPNAPSADAL